MNVERPAGAPSSDPPGQRSTGPESPREPVYFPTPRDARLHVAADLTWPFFGMLFFLLVALGAPFVPALYATGIPAALACGFLFIRSFPLVPGFKELGPFLRLLMFFGLWRRITWMRFWSRYNSDDVFKQAAMEAGLSPSRWLALRHGLFAATVVAFALGALRIWTD